MAATSTPPMGWNSWNTFGWRVTAADIAETAEAIVRLGLRELGYRYLVIDDCWSRKDGRDSAGNLVADAERFPDGIKPIADQLHAVGLKLGIYSDAAETTCAGWPGSFGHEDQDAALWASWGVDFLKYDYCGAPEDQATAIDRYGRMGTALRATGRDFVYSLCEWGGRAPHLWGESVGGTMWRVSADLFDSWVDTWVEDPGYVGIGVDSAIDIAAAVAEYSAPGHWNDLDMLIVGLRGKGQVHGSGMTITEYRTHMSVWAIAASPLMIGCDLRTIDDESLALLTNDEVIAVNQDRLGAGGRRVKRTGDTEVWRKPLADGTVAIALINRGSTRTTVECSAAEVGLLDAPKATRDLWLQEECDPFVDSLSRTLVPHAAALFRVGLPAE